MALLLLLLVALGAARAQHADLPQNGTECEVRLERCVSSETASQRRAVCGTNNQTYSSRCDLLHAQCQGLPLAVKHRGRCRELQPCWSYMRHKRSVGVPGPLFMPSCLEDGTYAPVQCYRETGFCWCVTPAGKLIPNTSERFITPQCNRKVRSSPRRRSSPRGQKQKKGSKNPKNCSRVDRMQFSNNIIKKFKMDYIRNSDNLQVQGEQGSTENDGDLERKVLTWKFTAMDRDGDSYLAGDEYKELRKMIRKTIKPKKCGKYLTKVCDKDEDSRISRDEWAFCLGLDFNHEIHGEAGDEWTNKAVLQGRIATSASGMTDISDDQVDGEPEANDCLSDRQSVLDEQNIGNTELYVPECTPDGRFQKKQCYKSTGYCWCVHEDDGKPIPGTSVKNQDPQCDKMPTAVRPMPGCPDQKKQLFLKELLDVMAKKMQAAVNKTTAESVLGLIDEWHISASDRIAQWNFNTFDKNKNKVLEKREWKGFRSLVTSSRQARKCGKKLPRYCDVNHDRRISLTEWLNCIRMQDTPTTNNLTPVSRRRGVNPLQVYLNDD